MNVGILLFEDVEVLDFAGPFEVFSVAAKTASETDSNSPFTVFTLAEHAGLVRCAGGLKVQPDYTVYDHPLIHLLIVPGGWGTRREVENKQLIDWIRSQAAHAQLITSVCTGAFLLGRAGLLEGHRVTTHWASIERLRHSLPNATVLEDVRFLDEGAIVTSAGISAGIDMALHLVARLHSAELAKETARRMEYIAGQSA
ncbi:MAG TPA: DJ-1/PfpI family protein [Ktedonobacterales bacterium]|jgi:transcriptional regulator GlxA family with amidase domain